MTLTDEERQAFGKYFVARGNTIQAAQKEREELDNLLNVLGKEYTKEQTKAEKPTKTEIGSLKGVEKTGSKGPYRQIHKSDNLNNPAFTKLQKYLANHSGFVTIHGFQVWSFDNPDIIGIRTK
jgi:hypothetical protein